MGTEIRMGPGIDRCIANRTVSPFVKSSATATGTKRRIRIETVIRISVVNLTKKTGTAMRTKIEQILENAGAKGRKIEWEEREEREMLYSEAMGEAP